jgi:putative ABC transport system permease protein
MGLVIPQAQRQRAVKALASGKVVMLLNADQAAKVASARVSRQRMPAEDDTEGEPTVLKTRTVPAVAITAPGATQPAIAVLPESLAGELGFTATTTSLLVDGVDISAADQDKVSEVLSNFGDGAAFGVERGFHDNSVAVALLLLGCVGGVLVLGGTLTATFLALSDARPDFATMSAVGAAPHARRAVAASYAATIGFVGAALGAAVGFVPGIAVTYPLTSASWAAGSVDSSGAPLGDHFLDIPWLLIGGLVVGLPLITALVVGLTSRSRLPMVSRMS